MITGYNHNVKYQDTVYHVQTEDSGVANPHIITHLFIGGNIIESSKTSYAELTGAPDMVDKVTKLMQMQHKTMLRGLIKGEFDSKLAERSINAAHLDGPAPINVEAGQGKTSFGVQSPEPAAPVVSQPPVAPLPASAPPLPVPQVEREEVSLLTMTSSFFGDAPEPEQHVIEAETLAKAFDSNDDTVVDSIFGEDLISERSLDEVILSYLADDIS